MDQMTSRERMIAVLRGNATDRPAWSLWRHFYTAESSAQQLADSMVAWARRYAFDFLKVNPRAQYHVEPWGARYAYSGGEHDRPTRQHYPMKQPDDWLRLGVRPLDTPAFAEQLSALKAIGAALDGELPFVETIFSPLGVAGYLVENDKTLVRHIREHPAAVHHGLDVITRTFAPFAAACLDAGADGIFFATTRWASRDYLTPMEYASFGRPYDQKILEAVRGAQFNILHVCDRNDMLLDLADYPVQAFNWAATDSSNPSVGTAASLPGLRIGGLSGEALSAAKTGRAEAEARQALEESGGVRWMLGPGCSIPTTSRHENIQAAARAVGIQP